MPFEGFRLISVSASKNDYGMFYLKLSKIEYKLGKSFLKAVSFIWDFTVFVAVI